MKMPSQARVRFFLSQRLNISFNCTKNVQRQNTHLYKVNTFEVLMVSSFFNYANKIENTQKYLDKNPIF
jgi:hypothetical protein